VREAASRVRSAGWRIENVDATVLAEMPRITPHVHSIEASIATELAIDAERVSVKATTLEGMGFVGREEGIAALAIATLARGPETSTP
jgi:2-C-methyl-D-erythritol 2,4-cyclodiphosphate synthase